MLKNRTQIENEIYGVIQFKPHKYMTEFILKKYPKSKGKLSKLTFEQIYHLPEQLKEIYKSHYETSQPRLSR